MIFLPWTKIKTYFSEDLCADNSTFGSKRASSPTQSSNFSDFLPNQKWSFFRCCDQPLRFLLTSLNELRLYFPWPQQDTHFVHLECWFNNRFRTMSWTEWFFPFCKAQTAAATSPYLFCLVLYSFIWCWETQISQAKCRYCWEASRSDKTGKFVNMN